MTYVPVANANGAVTFTFKVYDGALWSSAATYTITYAAVNDAPTSTGGAPGTEPNEDATYTFTTTEAHWGYQDVESSAMNKVDITTLPGTGTLRYGGANVQAGDDIAAGSLGGLTYVPVANANGAITFTFKVHDGTTWQTAGAYTYTITYAAVNDAPTSSGGSPGTEPNEDATYTFTTTEAHWGYADTESTAMHTVDITTLPGTGTCLLYTSPSPRDS